MAEAIRVLHVDDDPNITELTGSFLEAADDEEFVVSTASSATEGLEVLERDAIDCVVSDYQMPGMDGFEFLEAAREVDPELPFILFTGKGSEEIASEAISAGVTDYLQKEVGNSKYELLANRIVNAVDQYRAGRESHTADCKSRAPLSDLLGMYATVRKENGSVVVDDCSDRFADRLDYDREDVVGSTVSSLLAGDSEEVADALSNGSAPDDWDELALESADGDRVPMRYRVCSGVEPDGETQDGNRSDASGRIVNFVDASERDRLREELEWYRTLVDTVPDAIYALDEEMHYLFVNEGMADLTGYDREEIIGAHKSLINTDESVESGRLKRQDLRENDREGMKVALHPHVTADDEHIPTEVRFRALPTEEEDDFRGTAGVVRDITNRLEREEELERQNRRLEEFASVVSHDLRNPMNVVHGRVELARQSCECGATAGHLETARSELERMDAIIDDVLSFARHGQEVTDVEAVALGDVVESAWTAVGAEQAALRVDDDLTVRANELRLQRLLENLFRNAVEHVGDEVTVTVGATADGFYVEDDGPGVPPDDRDDVFEPGVTNATDGTGFGLAIVKTIGESHGWSVSLVEGSNGGARFEFSEVDRVDDADEESTETADAS